MAVETWLERVRKYGTLVVAIACVVGWALVFKSGASSSEWTGFWSSGEKTRGKSVNIREKDVETTAERDKRMARERLGVAEKREVADALRDLKTDVLGNKAPTRGRPLHYQQAIPREERRYTQRDICFQMKLEDPERYKDLDCMSEKYDDSEPWWQAPHR
jgi:hypothetical protein